MMQTSSINEWLGLTVMSKLVHDWLGPLAVIFQKYTNKSLKRKRARHFSKFAVYASKLEGSRKCKFWHLFYIFFVAASFFIFFSFNSSLQHLPLRVLRCTNENTCFITRSIQKFTLQQKCPDPTEYVS